MSSRVNCRLRSLKSNIKFYTESTLAMAAAWYSNAHVVHILAIVLLWKFSEFYTKTGSVFGEEIGRKLSRTNTVYDVSHVIRSNKNPNQSEILPGDLFVQEVNTSANYYFVAKDAADYDICWKNVPCIWYGIKGISLIVSSKTNKADVLALTDVPITNTTIENLLKIENSSIDSVTILLRNNDLCEDIYNINWHFVRNLQISNVKQSIKVGIEYNDDFLEHCAENAQLLEYLDHTVLRIHASPKKTMLSYGAFSRNVHRLIQENREFVRKICRQCTPYIRLHNEEWKTTISPDNYEKYNTLMTSYLDAFSKQNIGNEVFIFDPVLKRVNILRNHAVLRQSVSFSYTHIQGEQFHNISSQEKHILACTHQRMVKLLLSNFQNIIVFDPYLEVLSSLTDTCISSAENHFSPPSNTSLSLWLNNIYVKPAFDKQVEKILETLGNNLARIKISTVVLDADVFIKTDSLTKAVKLLQSQNFDTGCTSSYYFHMIQIETTNVSAIFGGAIQNCSALMNLSKGILVFVDVDFKIRKAEDVFTLLIHLDEAKQHFERLYPDTTLILSIRILTGTNKDSSYCSARVKQSKEIYETVYLFANIQGWSRVVLRPNFNDFGAWSRVRTDDELKDIERKKFPVLFRSNAPLTTDEELPMTYRCIQRTWDTRGSHINFLENQYSGATFRTNLRANQPLSTAELQTLLDLAISHFPSVEIIAVSQSDFKRVKTVILSDQSSKNFSLFNLSVPLVYVEVPLADAYGSRQEIHTVLSSKHVAVHVSNWESLSSKQLNQWRGFQYSSTSKIGVTAHNCSHEIDSKVTALKSLPFFSQVSYIVCVTSSVVPDNTDSDWMEKYMGTLFYTKSYMEHFLSIGRETGNGVEVMFRLNYICSKANGMEPFLRFLNDVNQHSAAYKIRYFLVRAFEGETNKKCVNTWWRPDSYTDLANISTYVNREDEYAGRRDRIFRPSVPEQNSNTVYFLIVVPILALLILGMLAQWLYQRKQKTKILTAREVRQFYNGGEQSNPSSSIENHLDFGNMKFPKRYEITLKDIQKEEIIGSGQFGVVHRGILSKRTEVAIKIPRSDCGKEQFKSTLSELKILCHIGEHLNIVSFLGAWTKGIENGKLSIVIEYCKNGCLLKYLRENRENDEQYGISLYQMNGFSHQIASGMEYIAEKRVVHGDLAARNVLLTAELTCKIADFGLSRRLYEMNEYAYVKTSDDPLPWRWMAPESLRDMEFTTKSDVWSYGVTLWEIFSLGKVPYPGLIWKMNFATELENGMRMEKAPHATDDIHAKILECWNMSSEARPNFTELKEFFVGLRNEQYLTLNKV